MQVRYEKLAILSQYLAPSRAVNAKCNTLSCDRPWQLTTLVAFKRQSLLMAGDYDEVYDKKPHRYAEDNRAAFNRTQW